MPLIAATWALAAVLGATGNLELGLRAEARGLAGGAPGVRPVEPVPWQLEPTLDLAGLLEPRLAYTVALAPTLLLLAGPGGGASVDSAAAFYAGSASLTWRADDRTTLTLASSAARGTLAMSALTQLSGQPAAPGAVSPTTGALDPGAGVRTGEFGSASVRSPFDWRATPNLTLGGAVGWSSAGGVGEASRLLFPMTTTSSLEGHGALAMTPLDGLALQASYNRTVLAAQGKVGIVDTLARWTRQLGPNRSAALGAGVAVAVENRLTATTTSADVTPRLEAAFTDRVPPGAAAGLGLGVLLGFAPYVDQFANAVRQRITASANLDWRLDSRRQITWRVSGASAVGGGGARQGVAASELTGWQRWSGLDVGLTIGSAYQEPQAAGGATAGAAPGALWQWSASVVTRWRQVPATE